MTRIGTQSEIGRPIAYIPIYCDPFDWIASEYDI